MKEGLALGEGCSEETRKAVMLKSSCFRTWDWPGPGEVRPRVLLYHRRLHPARPPRPSVQWSNGRGQHSCCSWSSSSKVCRPGPSGTSTGVSSPPCIPQLLPDTVHGGLVPHLHAESLAWPVACSCPLGGLRVGGSSSLCLNEVYPKELLL